MFSAIMGLTLYICASHISDTAQIGHTHSNPWPPL